MFEAIWGVPGGHLVVVVLVLVLVVVLLVVLVLLLSSRYSTDY